MKSTTRFLLSTLAGAACALSLHAETPAAAGHPDVSDWQPLFKEDLSDATCSKDVWSIQDGVMTASADEAIWAAGEYENFSLDLEFKTESGTNSGVIIYCTDIEKWIPNSVEIQIADDYHEKWAKADKTWQCAAVFGHLAPAKSVVKKPGEWNRMTITAKSRHITVTLNGEKVTDMDMAQWTSASQNPDGSVIPPWLNRPFATIETKGKIGLQGKHADASIFFRNVRIKVD